MGSKLISSGEKDKSTITSLKLGDLEDVSIENESGSHVLFYNEQNGTWENRSIEFLLEGYIPASVEGDDSSIEFSESGKL